MNLTRYLDYIQDLKSTLTSLNCEAAIIGNFPYQKLEVDIYSFSLGRGPKNILITSGIHGEEQAAPYALLQFIQGHIKKYLHDYTFTIIPIINPTGFSKKTRRGSGNRDLNRYFGKEGCFPENNIVLEFLKDKTFDHHFDMHEDIDIRHGGAYVYENGSNHGSEAKILELTREFLSWIETQGIKINRSPVIYGARNDQGIIHRPVEHQPDAKIQKLGALVPVLLTRSITKRGTTLETSMWYPFDLRVTVQVKHLNFWLSNSIG